MVQTPVQLQQPSTEHLVVRASLYQGVIKPSIDQVIAGLLLILLAPLLVVVACSVRARLGPGVIYRQRRIGKNNRVFTMYKFRTMALDRRTEDAPFAGVDRRVGHKRDDDPRHTTLGRALRRWSLDEIPQLWNVMLGHMSLVGPRPELEDVVAKFGLWDHPRRFVKPGITGLFQISPDRAGLLHEHLDYDIEYVSCCGFRRDLHILFRTPRAVWNRQGH